MCGINGIICKRPIIDIKKRVNKMNDALFHRGPDAGSELVIDDNKVGLGHRRLSIIDLDNRSNQPMCSKNNNIIVYNGEIYNYKQLKANLKYSFATSSDTEVLLAGMELCGIDFISKCNGMFGFGYYDNTSKTLYLVRDRLGIKPLYYYADHEKIIFSSEIKGILQSGLVKAMLNEGAVDEYLGNRYIRAPYTFFENIFQVPAGKYVTWNAEKGISIHTYWELPKNFNTSIKYNEEDIYSEFRSKMIGAVEKRMVADVPLGTYLSGGVDSSLVSAIAARSANERINTYTIGYEELNEFDFARKISDIYSTIHHEIHSNSKDYMNGIEELIRYKDAPLGVPNEIPLAIMSKRLKKDITVVLSGEGADELLGGYGKIYRSPFDFENHDTNKNFYEYFIDLYEYVPREIRNKYLVGNHSIREAFDVRINREFAECCNEENVFRFFHKYHVKGLLQRVDTTTMYASVEARVPFLDHDLVEFSYCNIPYSMKLRWKSENDAELAKKMFASQYSEKMDIPKYLLKKMSEEYLPMENIYREKMGFPIPLNMWRDTLCEIAKQKLKDATWIVRGGIEHLIAECYTLPRFGQIIWMLINVQVFYENYFEKEWRY